jgi:hypothetical protein
MSGDSTHKDRVIVIGARENSRLIARIRDRNTHSRSELDFVQSEYYLNLCDIASAPDGDAPRRCAAPRDW